MTRTKLAFVGFVAARSCMRQQVLNDAKSLPTCGRSQSATTCDSFYARNSAQYYSVLRSTTPYYKALLQYFKVLQGTTPVLFRTSLCYKALLQYYCTTKYCSSTTLYYEVLLQYYKVGSWALPPRGASGHWVLWQSRSSTSQPKVMSGGIICDHVVGSMSFICLMAFIGGCGIGIITGGDLSGLAAILGDWTFGAVCFVKVFLTIMDACAHLCGDLLWLLWGFQQELLACCFLGFFVIIGIGYIGWWCIMCQATCAMGNCG